MSNASDFVIENGVLKKYKGTGGDVVIPEGVTSIDDSAFFCCSSLMSVVIPEGVTSIGSSAFSRCSSLTSVVIPDSVTGIGGAAFWGCSSLTNVVIPEGVTGILRYTFSYCSSLTSVVIPDSVTSIGDEAFHGCSSLTSIALPERIMSIGKSEFRGCSSLTSVTLPESLTSIGDYAFWDCSGLTSITLPESLTSIGGYAFWACSGLTRVLIPGSVASIGDSAFKWCDSLTSITLLEGVTSIGDYAFHGCSSLTSITLPESLTSIGDDAFLECKGLKDIDGFVIIRGVLYYYDGNGGDIVIPEGVTSIGKDAFWDCRDLTSITLPEGLTNIGKHAFSGCISLTSVVIPEGVTSIGKDAFSGCISLTSVVIPDSVTCIGNQAFYGCDRAVFHISNESANCPANFVIENDVLKKYKGSGGDVIIPTGIKSIGNRAFRGCSSLTSITLPEGVTSIDNNSFGGCSNLRSITLPDGRDITWLLEIDPKGELSNCLCGICRDADEAEVAKMITQSKKWPSKWKKSFYTAYLHSDTRAAMMLADKRGEFSQYAALHNADEDELRDRMLSDLGLNEQHCKLYDLGNQSVTARLLPDFKFALETSDGKTIRSLPKKGADPEKYDAAKKDFAQMKKDAVKIWKNRADVLQQDFLSGKERTAEYWSRTYGGNPILHGVACLLVWEQNGQYFTRTDAGTIHADGTPYELTEEPIRLAHPMEMKPEEVDCWQHYFTSHGLKQPFEQIWEPVEQADLVKPGRYDDCTIPLYMLMNKEKHGIIMEGQKKLTLRDCTAELVYIEGHHDWINNEFEVKNFRFKKYTRQVNHIVVHLDKGTVAGRIKKDDITAARWFDRFTLAQITEFIKTAQEANAVNVLAELLEYKNAHFADFDPMEEFTLEW